MIRALIKSEFENLKFEINTQSQKEYIKLQNTG